MAPVDAENPPLAVIFGVEGHALNDNEKALLKEANPLGFILFGRNCDNPDQVRALTSSMKELLGRDCPILIDQEGGRVRRLKPPHWADMASARSFGEAAERDPIMGVGDLRNAVQGMSRELSHLGINVDCTPVLDVLFPDTHDAIGDRAYSFDPESVGWLGGEVCNTLLQNRIIPVMKHLPGQGRSALDSHYDLPMVSATHAELMEVDFQPFKFILRKVYSEGVWGMVSHIVYKAIDERAPASCSRRVIYDVIRTEIGFKGLLLSDDIGMGALAIMGDAGLRAEKVVRAGCDIALHCDGKLQDMEKVAKRLEKMTNDAVMRYNRSVSWLDENVPLKMTA